MGNNYTRQSAADIQTGLIVEAAPINAEFNQLQSAFDGSTGHTHDGTIGEGPKISLTSSVSGVLPVANGGSGGINKLDATTAPTANDDANDGYTEGSLWVDVTNDIYYICVDATPTLAIWQRAQLFDAGLQSISGLTTAADRMIYTTALDTYAVTPLTSFARTVLDDTTAGAALTTYGFSAYIQTLIDDADAATARATLGLTIGTNVQAFDATLASLAAYNTNGILTQTAADTFTGRTITGTANEITLTNGNGVSGNPTISLPSALTFTGKTVTGGTFTGITDIAVADGGTGASTVAGAQTNLSVVGYTSQTLTASQQNVARNNISSALRGHIFGLTLANSGVDAVNDITIEAGEAASTESEPVLMILPSTITKRLDAGWAVGDGNGGLDTGAIANGTYHLWLIQRSDTGVTDVLFSTSATGPTMPANYDRKRRIGSIIRAAGTIRGFQQVDDTFMIGGVTDRNSVAGFASALLNVNVPTGVVVRPLLRNLLVMAAASAATVSMGSGSWGSALIDVQQVNSSATDIVFISDIWTNTSAEIYYQVGIGAGSIAGNSLVTFGWIDTRGK